MTKEELKKKYDGKSLKEIEEAITGFKLASYENRQSFILALYYLCFTDRYREDKTYKKAEFNDYLFGRWVLRPTTYHNEKIACLNFPEMSKRHGPGVITKIKKSCGADKVHMVLNKINKLECKDGQSASWEQINDIILVNAKPTTVKEEEGPTKADWRKEAERLTAELIESQKKSVTLSEQVSKLKKTVSKYKAKAEEWETKFKMLKYTGNEEQVKIPRTPVIPGHEKETRASV